MAYSPTVANGIVYLPTSRDLYAYYADCYTGCSPLWVAGSGGYYSNAPYTSPTVSDGLVYSADVDGLQVYSTTYVPAAFTVSASKLKPSAKLAKAEARFARSHGL